MKTTRCVLTLAFATVAAIGTSCSTQSAASGASGTRLALSEPADQSLEQGESGRVAITVERTGFADAVRVSFSNLPAGVRVEGDSIQAGDTARDFVLIASPTAGVVDRQIVTVQAHGSNISTSQTFELTVRARN